MALLDINEFVDILSQMAARSTGDPKWILGKDQLRAWFLAVPNIDPDTQEAGEVDNNLLIENIQLQINNTKDEITEIRNDVESAVGLTEASNNQFAALSESLKSVSASIEAVKPLLEEGKLESIENDLQRIEQQTSDYYSTHSSQLNDIKAELIDSITKTESSLNSQITLINKATEETNQIIDALSFKLDAAIETEAENTDVLSEKQSKLSIQIDSTGDSISTLYGAVQSNSNNIGLNKVDINKLYAKTTGNSQSIVVNSSRTDTQILTITREWEVQSIASQAATYDAIDTLNNKIDTVESKIPVIDIPTIASEAAKLITAPTAEELQVSTEKLVELIQSSTISEDEINQLIDSKVLIVEEKIPTSEVILKLIADNTSTNSSIDREQVINLISDLIEKEELEERFASLGEKIDNLPMTHDKSYFGKWDAAVFKSDAQAMLAAQGKEAFLLCLSEAVPELFIGRTDVQGTNNFKDYSIASWSLLGEEDDTSKAYLNYFSQYGAQPGASVIYKTKNGRLSNWFIMNDDGSICVPSQPVVIKP